MKSNLYFNPNHLPIPKGEYVLWCDGMGTGRSLTRSLSRAAVFIFKMHEAFDIAISRAGGGRYYPVMDGIYVTSPKQSMMRFIIREAFCELAREFIRRRGTKNMFMVRAGLAYGLTIHGRDIDPIAFHRASSGENNEGADYLHESTVFSVKNQMLLSPAMVSAYNAERNAPPFGVYVDDSAKSIPQLVNEKDSGFISNLHQWWRGDKDASIIASQLAKQIEFYLDRHATHTVGSGYAIERIRIHQKLVEEYFGGFLR